MNKNRISPIPFDFNQLYTQYMYSYPHKTAYRPLPCVSLKDYGRQLAGKGHGLYLHIPFCQSKCGYCNLFSVTGQGTEDVDRYLDAVERQALQYGDIKGEPDGVFWRHGRGRDAAAAFGRAAGSDVCHTGRLPVGGRAGSFGRR